MKIGSSENVEKEDLNPEEEDLDKDAIDNEDIDDDPTKWRLNGTNFYMVPSYTNIEQYSQFNRTILNFVLLFKFLIYKCVSKKLFVARFC